MRPPSSRERGRVPGVLIAIALILLSSPVGAQQDQPSQLRFAGFVALNVSDLASMLAFYQAIGFTQEFRRDTAAGAQIGLGLPTRSGLIGPNLLLIAAPDAKPGRESVLSRVAWAVRDVASVCRKATEIARKPCQPQDNTANKTRIAFTQDPDGNRVEFIENY